MPMDVADANEMMTRKAASNVPILPSHITSTSSATRALAEYHSKGEDEVDLEEGDTLRMYKRHYHWVYVS